jgi:hypothetical protein
LDNLRAFMADPDPQSFAVAILKACESPVRVVAVAVQYLSIVTRHRAEFIVVPLIRG